MPTPFPGLQYAAAAWGDYDGDGDLDLLLTGRGPAGPITRIYRNDGAGVFIDLNVALIGVEFGAVAWGDYDRDGDLDILLTGVSASGGLVARVYRNDGGGQFTDIQAGLSGVQNGSAAWGDFDNDGDLDILLAGVNEFGSSVVTIYRNDGPAGFHRVVTSPGSLSAKKAAWVDYDGDGDPDLFLAGLVSPASTLYRNDGTNTFTVAAAAEIQPADQAGAAWVDYDNDGDLDLVEAGLMGGSPGTMLYQNEGGGVFQQATNPFPRVFMAAVAWGDFNNDGLPDLVVAGRTPQLEDVTALFQNLGGGSFSNSGVVLPGIASGTVAWADYDGNGTLDLLVVGDGQTALFRNDQTPPNQPPSAPDGLQSAVLANNEVRLSWNAATDLESTNSLGLSYNVFVRNTDTGTVLVPAQANLSNGTRLLPGPGNAGLGLGRWLSDVPKGNYAWRVQAIDAAFAGSSFSAEATFAVTNARPTISTVGDLVIPPGGRTPAIGFSIGDLETSPALLTVTASVSDTNLVPSGGIVFGGSGADRTVTVTPAPTARGTVRITLTVTDEAGASADAAFQLRIEAFSLVFSQGQSIAVAAGDFDNDGRLDFAAQTGNDARLWRNLGGGVFTNTFTVGLGSGAIAWGDYDNDGFLDLFVSGQDRAARLGSRLFHNKGDGTFTTNTVASIPGVSYGAAAWGDFDGDGLPDLALCGETDTFSAIRTSWIFRNNGDGTFTDAHAGLPGVSDGSVAWADFDNDGHLDLLLCGAASRSSASLAQVYHNLGNGTFKLQSTVLPAAGVGQALWADFDNDGYPDILMSTRQSLSSTAGFTRLYRNNGDGTFSERTAGLPDANWASIACGDANNDGLADVLIAGLSNGTSTAFTKVYLNTGDGVFAEYPADLPGINFGSVTWADFDGDGRLDIALGWDGFTRIYRNNSASTNRPPTPPGGLASVTRDGSVLLTWEAATDPDQQGGLSYNVRVGSAPAGQNILSALADAASGLRRIPEPGNAGTRLSLSLTNLSVGTYYWIVQAIDQGFAGSPFAAEAVFTITNTAPRLSPVPPQTDSPAAPSRPIPFIMSDAESPPEALVLSVSSSETNLLPSTNIVVSGTGTNRTLVVYPASAQRGTTTITLTVTDPSGAAATRSFPFILEEFTVVATNLWSVTETSAAWGDFDGDGDLDFVAHGTTGGLTGFRTRLFRNDNGVFTNVNIALPAPQRAWVTWGDADRDNDLDLLVLGAGASAIARNGGSNNFSFFSANLPSIYGGFGSWTDVDRDGDVDIVITGGAPGAASFFFFNDGTGTFRRDILTRIDPVSGSAQAWGDFDNDGYPDVLVMGGTANGPLTRLYRNLHNSRFETVPVDFPGLLDGAAAWADYDNDGDLDLVITGQAIIGTSSAYLTRIYRQDPGGHFVDIGAGLPDVHFNSVAWGDYDNDGRPDLLLAGEITRIYHNEGNDVFRDAQITLQPVGYGQAVWGDYDNDGDLDILICGDGATRIYRNNIGPINTQPTRPAGLSANRTAVYDALFNWSPSSDAQTADPRGLSYNLRIGTSPGGTQVLSPQADLASGRLRSVQPGNGGRTNAWIMPALAPGTYYWSVQAIDPGFAASPFATESVYVHRVPPIIAPESAATNTTAAGALVSGSVNPGGLAASWYIEYGLTAAYGRQTGPQNTLAGTLPAAVTVALTNLLPGMTYHYRVAASNSLGVAFGPDRAFTTLQFTELEAGMPPMTATLSAWADYDNDGDFDVLLAGFDTNSPVVRLLRNDGNGNFTEIPIDLPPLSSVTAAWGDFDNDGDLDLVLCGSTDTQQLQPVCLLLRNDGADRFVPVPGALPNLAGGALAWADFDNDGRLDLLATGTDESGVCRSRILRNLGSGAFADSGALLPACCWAAAAVADFDGDGDVDIVLSTYTIVFNTQASWLCRNEGAFRFTTLTAGLPLNFAYAMDAGDVDNDGDPDLLFSGGTLNSPLSVILKNDGTGSFAPAPVSLPDFSGTTAAWGDYDNDGRPDILLRGVGVSNAGALVRPLVYHNGGGGVLSDIGLTTVPPNQFPAVAAWVDFDGDGDLDIFVSGSESNGNVAKFFRNETLKSNHPPTAPADLASAAGETGARLTWSPAADEDQAGGLSYNLRIGTRPGGVDICSPHADPVNGRRRIQKPGNAGPNLAWSLTHVDAGQYFWSVQAIDHSFAGSAFAPEQSFVVPTATNGPPLILSVQFPSPTAIALTVVGHAGNTYSLQSSPDLGQWTEVDRIPFDQHLAQWRQPVPPDAPVRFFRIQLVP